MPYWPAPERPGTASTLRAIVTVQVGAEKPAGARAGRVLVAVSPNSSMPCVTLNGGAEL